MMWLGLAGIAVCGVVGIWAYALRSRSRAFLAAVGDARRAVASLEAQLRTVQNVREQCGQASPPPLKGSVGDRLDALDAGLDQLQQLALVLGVEVDAVAASADGPLAAVLSGVAVGTPGLCAIRQGHCDRLLAKLRGAQTEVERLHVLANQVWARTTF